jgi:hypothetical protein
MSYTCERDLDETPEESNANAIIYELMEQQWPLTLPYYERIFCKKPGEMTQAEFDSDEYLLLQAAGYFSVVWRDLVMAAAEHDDNDRDDNVRHAAKEMGHAISMLNLAGWDISC